MLLSFPQLIRPIMVFEMRATQSRRAQKAENTMKFILRMVRFSLMTSLICFAALMSAQSPDHEQNLFACKNGFDSCDRSALTQADKNDVTAARHEQNLSDCKIASSSCDRSALSAPELAEVAIAVHRNMVSDCWNGLASCNHSKLSQSETAEVAVAT